MGAEWMKKALLAVTVVLATVWKRYLSTEGMRLRTKHLVKVPRLSSMVVTLLQTAQTFGLPQLRCARGGTGQRRNGKALFIASVIPAFVGLYSLPAAAAIIGSTGEVTVLSAPPAVVGPGGDENNNITRVFLEKTLTLPNDLTVDNTATGTYPPNSSPGVVISAGTAISSYFFDFDPVTSGNSQGSVTFDRDIVGVIFTDARLNATDCPIGAPGTPYGRPAGRQVELSSNDTFTISTDRRTISFNFSADSGEDQMRVIVVGDPSTLPAAGTGDARVLSAPPAEVAAGGFEDNNCTRVFLEKTLTLSDNLTVDNTATGTYPPNSSPSAVISAGTAISSYFFDFDPFGRTTTVSDSIGSVTFDRDILGVIYTASRLRATDGSLGASGTTYSPTEGTQGSEVETSINDTFTISPDRRTIGFHFFADVGQDQMRVILGAVSQCSSDTDCDDGNKCNGISTCQSGTCTQTTPPVTCTAQDVCHNVGTCDPTTGLCSNPNAPDGASCNDGNACTQTDTCQSGTCTGTNPVVCTASDQCHDVGTCDAASGACSNPAKANGATCSDGNACTQSDTCQSGTCTGSNPVVCTASDQCHDAGTCNPTTGVCSNPAKANGTTCNDGNACTRTDTCQSGTCTGGNPVVCTASDQCHDAGTCNPGTGTCSNPAKANSTTCDDGNKCTQSDTCQAGVCTGGPAPDVLLHVIKHVVNTDSCSTSPCLNGLVASDFDLTVTVTNTVNGTTATLYAGAEAPGTAINLKMGDTFAVTEDLTTQSASQPIIKPGGVQGDISHFYTKSFCDGTGNCNNSGCSGTATCDPTTGPQEQTCTVTNDDILLQNQRSLTVTANPWTYTPNVCPGDKNNLPKVTTLKGSFHLVNASNNQPNDVLVANMSVLLEYRDGKQGAICDPRGSRQLHLPTWYSWLGAQRDVVHLYDHAGRVVRV
jgi:hypothetical protein